MSAVDLTIIIPAFNEGRFIARQLPELRQHTRHLDVQIIVVDNGSTDSTMQLAREGGADVVLRESGTVGAIRNIGVGHAKSDVLAFMDADVFPTTEWAERISEVLKQVRQQQKLVTGSWVSVPDKCTWLEKHWFKPLEHGSNTHINSGHLIISRGFFDNLRGFDPALRTGEDYDLSMRAVAAGGEIRDDLSLKVIHEGYPKRLGEFMRREMWHGIGDVQSVKGFVTSKVALLGFFVSHAQIVGWLASLWTRDLSWGVAATGISVLLSVTSSCVRYRRVGFTTRVVTTALYFAYFLARGMSPYAAWRRRRVGSNNQGTARH